VTDRPRLGPPVRLLVVTGLLVTTGCGARLFVPPAGPGQPAPEAAAIWNDLTADCRGIESLVVGMRVSGPGVPSLSITGAITSDGRLRLDARAAGTTQFILFGSAADAAIWLRDGNRVAHGAAEAIVETLVGVRLEPERLLAVLTGCMAKDLTVAEARRYGDRLAVVTSDTRAYLRHGEDGWVAEAALFDRVIVQYDAFDGGWPARILMRSAPGTAVEFRLSIAVSDRRAGPVAAEAFEPEIPADAVPVELEALASGA